MQKQLLMGNEAFAHAALKAGVRVAAGYPGTPSSEVIETIAAEHAAGRAQGIHVEWSTNEKAALELLAGAAYAGARTLFTCKQVGLNVASDALMSLNYVGIKGGTVLFVADDPGPISSQTEQDTRRFGAFAKVPVLDPATPDQGCEMIEAAYELSEAYRTPVIVRPTTRVCHASTFLEFPDVTIARDIPEEGFVRDSKWVIFPKRAFEAHGEINERLKQIAEDASTGALAAFNPIEGGGTTERGEAPQLGIVAGGVSTMYVREALRILAERCHAAGVDMPAYRFMQIGMPFPFPEHAAQDFAGGLDQIIVFEELDHVIEDALLAMCGKLHAGYEVLGKLNGYTRDRGENTVDDALERLAKYLGIEQVLGAASARPLGDDVSRETSVRVSGDSTTPLAYDGALPVRPPVLCAGCPHRGSFYAIKRALGKTPAVLCGDIGCYTLGNAMPLDAVDTCLCMGAGITMAQGFSVVEPQKKTVAFVGDSTFFASGLTGIVNAVYNQHDITVAVLDNATTAMTGSQPHPGTGVTLMGPKSQPVSIESVLKAVGFKCIVHANPFVFEESAAAAKEAIEFEGPSAIIYEGPCISLSKPGEPVSIDAGACTGCKRCITEIGCPGIGFDASLRGPASGGRGQAFIDRSLCNGCGLCTQICPFDAILLPGQRPDGAEERGEGASHA